MQSPAANWEVDVGTLDKGICLYELRIHSWKHASITTVTCVKVGARPSDTGEKVCWGPCRLKKLAGRGSSSVSVYTCLIPVSFKAATSAGLLGVADAANLHQAFAHP